jgi:RNA polymerase sigma-70 factor, ECF subfamily
VPGGQATLRKNFARHATLCLAGIPDKTAMTKQLPDILQACKKGDRLAQKQFYEHFKDKMFALCLRYTNSREDAEDVLQEGFVKVFRDLHQYKGAGSLEGWVRKVILNVALLALRRKMNDPGTVDLDQVAWKIEGEAPAFEEGPPAKGLIKLMQKMPPGFRTVLNLYVLEGYTHPQIAVALGISEGTSKSQLSRAKAFMKNLLQKNLTG